MNRSILALILSLIGATANVKLVQGVPPSQKGTPVTSTIQNADPLTGVPYHVQSDTLGPYSNTVNSVVSVLQGPYEDWVLDGKSSTLRRVFFDFRDPVTDSSQTPNPPFQTALAPWRFISKCSQFGIDIRNLGLNQMVLCPLAISIDYGGATYAVRMNPANYPETEWVQWTCLALNSTGKCNAWQLEPNVIQADGQRKAKGQLLKIASRPNQTDEPRGVFYFSFRINVTLP